MKGQRKCLYIIAYASKEKLGKLTAFLYGRRYSVPSTGLNGIKFT